MKKEEEKEEVFARFYRDNSLFLWRVVSRLGVPDDKIMDVVHDSFVAAFEAFDRFEGRSSEKTWLFGIANNLCRNYKRKEKKRSVLWGRFVSQSKALLSVPLQPDDLRVTKELATIAERALQELKEPYHSMLVLVDFEGVSIAEASQFHGLSKDRGWSILRTARKRFQSALPAELLDNPKFSPSDAGRSDNKKDREALRLSVEAAR